jgi:hypothetical protein
VRKHRALNVWLYGLSQPARVSSICQHVGTVNGRVGQGVGTTLPLLLAAAAALGYVAVFAYAIGHVARTRVLSAIETVAWVTVVLFALLGSIVWYAAGPHPCGLRLVRSY